MLTLNKIQSIEYYSDLANEDYYLDGGEPNGEWAGKGAVLLGLRGAIDDAEYRNILKGRSPDGSEKLCSNDGVNHKPGWDLTFSAPKSVSVAWARSEQDLKEKIQKAHKDGVKAALSLLEEHAAFTRRGKNGVVRENTTALVAVLFEHCTSRAQDPQLHTHCLVANAAPRTDGSWGTIVSRDLYFWQRAAGALYRAELAAKLAALGFQIEKDKDAFHITGISRDICAEYSKRTAVIREGLKKRGNIKSASKAGDFISLSTREKKADINRLELYDKWHEELEVNGLTHDQFDSLLVAGRENDPSLLSDDIVDAKPILNVELINDVLTERRSIFRKQDIFKVAAEIAQISGDTAKVAQQVAKDFLAQEETLELGMDFKHNQLFTTKEVLEAERSMIAGAKVLRGLAGFSLSDAVIDNALLTKDFLLSEEQRESVVEVCQNNRFAILQGSAGAGKSASMDCVRAAYEAKGYRVIGAAIAKSAAKNLAKEANIVTHTVAKLLMDIESNRAVLDDNTILLIDEAGQVGTKQLNELISHAVRLESKIILVGEDKQLDAIERAGSLRYLSRPEIMGATRIETIRRQGKEWARQAVVDLRDGNTMAALCEHDKRGLLSFNSDADAAKAALIDQWNNYRYEHPDKKHMILAQRWIDVSDLNNRVRRILQSEGQVSRDEIEIDCCVSDRHVKYNMAVGERVRLTKNDYRLGYTNGDLGTITNVMREQNGNILFNLMLDSGREVGFSSASYSNDQGHVYLTQAYASTVYSSQGQTIDGDTFVYYTSGMNRANSYVAGSRHKDNCHWFFNKKELVELHSLDVNKLPEHEALLQTISECMALDAREKLAVELISEKTKELVKEPEFIGF